MSGRADLLVELGCEELPARLLVNQADMLFTGVCDELEKAGIDFDRSAASWYASPRRLSLMLPQVADSQPDQVQERKGPAVGSAFDADGQPTAAAMGFARSVGRSVSELERTGSGANERLYATVRIAGQALKSVLEDILVKVTTAMAGSRSMRWSDSTDRFLRPVRWLVVLHGDQVLPIELFGLRADRLTQGHRIHGPGPIELAGASDYCDRLRSAYVEVDRNRRRARIAEQLQAIADRVGLTARPSNALLDEVADLTEWPVAIDGRFDERFLEVPAEALIASLEQHQKCFPLFADDGTMANHFVAVANIESRDPEAMRQGFERVIRPRLADARFFWDQDRRQPLSALAPGLASVKYQEQLGSQADRCQRIATLARSLAGHFGADPQTCEQAAVLSKCDLLTDMVGEFPELQGIMGRHYAVAGGEDPVVAAAIESHYLPRFSGDRLPEDSAGQVLAVADRLDSLVGIFAAGQIPRGGKDPYALRRAALGLVRILEHARLNLSLRTLLEMAAQGLPDHLEADLDAVEAFVYERLRSHVTEQGLAVNTFHAVMAAQPDSIADACERMAAVERFLRLPAADSLVAANKRIRNILDKAGETPTAEVDPGLLDQEAEKVLAEQLDQAGGELSDMLERRDYSLALTRLAALEAPTDRFFDEVMVMVDDPALRQNRLALLKSLADLFGRIVDAARLGR